MPPLERRTLSFCIPTASKTTAAAAPSG